jgi:hypothetical protein
MERQYSIYKITSPSSKCYIGLTSQSVLKRWQNHCSVSNRGKNHPFHSSIRKYGQENFIVETLFTDLNKEQAQTKEIECIASIPKKLSYNLSKGGEADGAEGSRIFWAKVNSDPVYKAQYLKNLSEGLKRGKGRDYIMIAASAKKWRDDNPRLCWKLSHRGLRLANKANTIKFSHLVKTEEPSLKQRLQWKFKRGKMSAIQVTKVWAERDEETKKEIFSKISETLKEKNKKLSAEEKISMVSKARSCIDRSVQGPAASAGIKKFWVDLKADPERFKAHMEAKTKRMMETRNKQKNENL